jgi:hypothetical protein
MAMNTGRVAGELGYTAVVLSFETRPLTADERAWLEAERARLVAEYTASDEALQRSKIGAGRALLWPAGLFAALASFHLWIGRPDLVAISGTGVLLMLGFAAYARFTPAREPILDRPKLRDIDVALARDLAQVIGIEADAALVVRDAEDREQILGDLLRTGSDQVIYVSRGLYPAIDEARLPSTSLRITHLGWGFPRAEPVGERCEVLGSVDNSLGPNDSFWVGEEEPVVWTPSSNELRMIDLELGELTCYPPRTDVDFGQLAAGLWSRSYR